MAIADFDPLFNPLRGKILGTVFQTGRNAPVIKSIDNNKNQSLANFRNSQARLQHAASLWRQLSPADQASWNAARPNFPTVDRYGNPVLSTAYSLFLRAVAPLPSDRQVFLSTPGSIFTGTLPPDAAVENIGGAITFKSMEAPSGQNFDASVFCTRYNPVSKDFPKPSFRQVLRLDDYTGLQSVDITNQIINNFGPLDLTARIFWCVKTWKTGTPELVGYTCGTVAVENPYIWIADETPGYVTALGQMQVSESYTGRAAVVSFGNQFFTNGLWDPSIFNGPRAGYYWDQIQNAAQVNFNNWLLGTPGDAAYTLIRWSSPINYPLRSDEPFTFITLFSYPASTRTSNSEFIRKGDTNGADGGFRMFLNTAGRIQFLLRRNASFSLTYDARIVDDDFHVLAITYDGSLNRTGVNVYLDDMTTPLVPDSVAGTTCTAGAYLPRVQYYWFGNGATTDGARYEFHLLDNALTPAQLAQFKNFFLQNPKYAALL